MKLWILSDLHADSSTEDIVPPADFDVFVCAGDVLTGDIESAIEMVAALAGGKPTVFVAGNHEWMTSTIEETLELGHAAAARTGLHFQEFDAVELGGVRFAGATLWTRNDVRYAASVMALQLNSKPDEIVTHFEPSADLLMRAGSKLWIYGHHHGFYDRTIGSRRIVRNAVGSGVAETLFDSAPARSDFVVEIEP